MALSISSSRLNIVAIVSITTLALFAPDLFAASGVTIPNVGGGGGDIKDSINTHTTDAYDIGMLLIGAGVVIAVMIAAGNFVFKRWREGIQWILGALVGGTVGSVVVMLAKAFVK